MKIKFCVLLLGSLLGIGVSSSHTPPSNAQATTIAIINANIIDGLANEPLRNTTVLVSNSKIEHIGPASIPSSMTVLDLKGRWLLPGFVDAHAHVRDLRAARTALQSGATTLRDLGVDHFVDIGIRDLNRAGVADLPDIIAAGYHVRSRPAEELFVDLPKLSDLMGKQISGEAALRRIVRAQIERGVNVIKINATERAGLPDTDPRKRIFTDEEIAAIVDEARKANIFVAAHAHGDEGAYAAVKGGVRSIEHGTYLSEKTLALMKERGTYFDPTIATVQDLIEPGGDYDNALLSIRGRHMLPRLREATAQAWKLGIKIIAGADTGYGPNSNRRIPHEVMALVEAGLPLIEAIKAATSLSAECAGILARTGAIKVGLEADLIAVERNPLENIGNLQDIILVLNNGQVVLNRLGW
jgi:imidazolonepropionase-like amidohydrolase